MYYTMVWLLLAVSDGAYNQGNAAALGVFKSEAECRQVATTATAMNKNALTRCILVKDGYAK